MATMTSAPQQPLRVIEFYAGIGGFHFSLNKSKVNAVVVASIDINTNANAVYTHNFPHAPHLNRNISGLTARELDKLSPDVFVLSPPCQPFTRQGLRRDNLDHRTDSFFHLMTLLTEMECPPSYLLLENVKGFEVSNTRDHFIAILHSLHFSFQEFLLSPTQFGVPNSRLRYYLLAKRSPLRFTLPVIQDQPENGSGGPCTSADRLLEFISRAISTKEQDVLISNTDVDDSEPRHSEENSTCDETVVTKTISTISTLPSWDDKGEASKHSDPRQLSADTHSNLQDNQLSTPESLSSYLEPLSDAQLSTFLVPDKILLKYTSAMDIVRASSVTSCCFTRAYGHYTVGTGSIVQHCLDERDLRDAFENYQMALNKCVSGAAESEPQDPLSFLRPLKLRYFTPREVANLMTFPQSFSFPDSLLSRTQCYKVMGNSVNVCVVSSLMQYLFCDVL